MSSEEVKTVVLDVGTCNLRAGIAGDDKPKSVIPTIFGVPRYQSFVGGIGLAKFQVCDAADSQRGILNIESPVRRGIITNFDQMEKIWHHTFYNELRVDPATTPVLLSEAAINPKANRRKTAEMMFETFKVPALYIAPQPVLSLFASGRNCGVVVESGDGITYAVPICNGFAIPEAIRRCDVAGSDVTDYLMEMLNKDGKHTLSRDSYSDRLMVRQLKEKFAYAALDYDAEMKKTDEELKKDFELRDGSVVSIGKERFQCSEILLRPEILGHVSGGIHQVAFDAIQKCDVDLRRDLYFNIIFSGGNTLLSGLAERVQKEIAALVKPEIRTKVVTPDERLISTWIGGSIQASLSTFPEIYVTKKEYDENGVDIVFKKCPSLVNSF